VKRLIGFPGETIRLTGNGVYVNDQLLHEPYEVIPYEEIYESYFLNPDEFFLLGDNRPMSADSQNFGPIEGSAIIGKALPVYWLISDAP
jgi:signal peptidase I